MNNCEYCKTSLEFSKRNNHCIKYILFTYIKGIDTPKMHLLFNFNSAVKNIYSSHGKEKLPTFWCFVTFFVLQDIIIVNTVETVSCWKLSNKEQKFHCEFQTILVCIHSIAMKTIFRTEAPTSSSWIATIGSTYNFRQYISLIHVYKHLISNLHNSCSNTQLHVYI